MTADDARKYLNGEESRIENNGANFSTLSYALGLLTLKADRITGGTLGTIAYVGDKMFGDIAERYDNLEAMITGIQTKGVYIKTVEMTTLGIWSTKTINIVSVYTYDGQLIGELGY